MRSWTADELRAFLAASAQHPLFPLYRLAASTGMRRGEILGLRWKDVDLERRRLTVRQQLSRQGEAVSFGQPKTKAGRRSIALDPATINVLRALREARKVIVGQFGAAYQPHDLVFARADGSPHDPDSVSHTFDRLVRAAGLPAIRLHDLRHTHATLALQAGVHPKVVQERLGHSSISVTLDLYSHAVPALEEDAAGRIAAMVDAPS
jgi:integrase